MFFSGAEDPSVNRYAYDFGQKPRTGCIMFSTVPDTNCFYMATDFHSFKIKKKHVVFRDISFTFEKSHEKMEY